ncbi:MAG TPA: zf-HC2 domain-containing protein [Gaiellales bacterium]|nr:zf-HC2 domain-containing protein [Gaiellales bacterium]
MSDHLDNVQLSRLIDGDLSLTSRDAAIAHLRTCPACAERHDHLVAVTAVLRLEPALEWTTADTDSVLERLPRRGERARLALAGIVSAAMCALVVVEAAPVIAAPLALVVALAGVGRALAAPAATSGAQLVLAVAAVAILAPLAAYPLARWR